MSLATLIDVGAATLGFCAGMFFCLGVLKIEDGTLETIATSMWGKGLTISKELALQKVDFQFGLGVPLVTVGVLLIPYCQLRTRVIKQLSEAVAGKV